MADNNKQALFERIIEFFEKVAPVIVVESVASLATDHPKIDLYDEDFYLENMKGSFDDIDETTLRETLTENIEAINEIFFEHYKKVKKPS